jgi:hypothetical protein
MSRFIKLNMSSRSVYVNFDTVDFFCAKDGGSELIFNGEDSPLCVMESPEQILEKL